LQPFTVAAASGPIFGEFLTGAQWGLGAVAVVGTIVMLVVQSRITKRAAATKAGICELEPDADAAAARAEREV